MSDFTYEKPNEAVFFKHLVHFLKKDTKNIRSKILAETLESGRCVISDSGGMFSRKRWNGLFTEIFIYIPFEKIDEIQDVDESILLDYCSSLMPPEAGLDVMNVYIRPEMSEGLSVRNDLEFTAQSSNIESIESVLPDDIIAKGRDMQSVYHYLYELYLLTELKSFAIVFVVSLR